MASLADKENVPAAVIARGQQHETILVVEDDAEVRALTTTMLEGLGYRVVSTASIAEARIMVIAQRPALLLTDVMLPGGNGRELADAALRKVPNLKVLFMSGHADSVNLQMGRPDQQPNLLQKPFRQHDLALKVRAVLDGDGAVRA